MKKQFYVPLLCVATTISITGVIAAGSNQGFNFFTHAEEESYTLVLNANNQPTDSTEYINTVSRAIHDSEYSEFSYETVKYLDGGHCVIGNNGYIEKVLPANGMKAVEIHKSGSGELSVLTGFEANDYITTYDVTSDDQTIPVCGNYIKFSSVGETSIASITIRYQCVEGSEQEGHEFGELHEAKAATYKEDGNAAYYECSHCHAYFDENKEHQLTTVVLPRIITHQTLTLVDATITSSEGSTLQDTDGTTRTYQVVAGNQVSIEADATPSGKMFVGFDKNTQNNRVGSIGQPTYTFEMPLEDMQISSVYCTLDKSVLTVPFINTFKYKNDAGKYVNYATQPRFDLSSNASTNCEMKAATAIDGSEEGLEGMTGYSVTFAGNATGISSYSSTRNIIGSHFESTNKSADMELAHWTYKAIFKNHSTRTVVVELYSEYYNNFSTSGQVSVPAGATVTKFFTQKPYTPSDGVYTKQGQAEPTSGLLTQTCFVLRNDLNGTADEDVVVDFVLGRAYTYKDNSVVRPRASTVDYPYLTFVGGTNNPDGATVSHGDLTYNSRYRVFTHSGALLLLGQHMSGSTDPDLYPASDGENKTYYAPGIDNNNAPAAGTTFDIYVRATNLMSAIPGSYSKCVPVYCYIDVISNTTDKNPSNFLTATSALVGGREAMQEVAFESFGSEQLLKITVTRPSNSAKLWFVVRGLTTKANIANRTVKYNFAIQASFENIFGYEE